MTNGTKIRVTLERWGSRTFKSWYSSFSKNTKIGLGNTNSIIRGNDIILEEAFNGLHFSVACRILGEKADPEIISLNRIELETSLVQADHDITLMVSVVTSNESDNPTESAIKLLDNAELKLFRKKKKIIRNGGVTSGASHLYTLGMITLKTSIICAAI